jgi:hypothetical protein
VKLPTGPASTSQPGPGREWTLTASNLTLNGVRYQGYSDQQVAGQTVKTLHFTVSSLQITNLVQRGMLGNGQNVRVAAAPGSVSTVTNGPIELYTANLSGTLSVAGFPVAPITLSPDSLLLPDLDLGFLKLPSITFKNATVRNVDLDGGTLFIPGADITLE